MKLLGWMHRKLRQNTTNETTPKDFPIDDMLHCYQKGNHKPPFGKAQRGNSYPRNSFTSLESARVEHENHDDPEDNNDIITDHIFHGFLAIGTLGGDTQQFTTEPSTPTFNSISAIAEKETQVTENEMKLINDELEKVLMGDDVSSGRDSQVSAGRISCCSAVTLLSADTCPLQSYLFGSAAETAAPPSKKEQRRTSLGDLFQKTKHHLQEEETKTKDHHHQTTTTTTTDKSAVHVMKKMLKKTIHNVHKTSTPLDSDKKLHKILQMFTRKVHPENPTMTTTAGGCDNKLAKKSNVGSDHGGSSCYSEDIIIYPQVQPAPAAAAAAASKEDHIIRCCKKSQSLTTTGNHEFWVKTDADYLVLEL